VLHALAERPRPVKIEAPWPTPANLATLLDRAGITDLDPERLFAVGFEKPQRLFTEMVRAVSPPEIADGMVGPEGPVVAALPSTSVNAESSIAPDGRAVIVVNQGVEAFLYNFMRVFATELRFTDEQNAVPLDRDQKIRLLTQLMDWANTPMTVPRMHTFDATAHQREFASQVTTEAARFVVAHEFAHVFLHHHASAGRREANINGHRVEVSDPSWEQEYAADRSAMNMMMEMSVRGALRGDFPFAAVELLFQATGLLEELADLPNSGTHPPAADRLRALRADLEQSDATEQTRLGLTQVARWLEVELDKVRDPVLDAARRGHVETRQLVEQLLVDCTTAAIPDYERFAAGIEPLLNERPSATLAAMRDELHRMHDLSPISSAERPDSPPFKRWRLAFNFALAVPPYLRVALDADEFLDRLV
jgi:hypothetical protein